MMYRLVPSNFVPDRTTVAVKLEEWESKYGHEAKGLTYLIQMFLKYGYAETTSKNDVEALMGILQAEGVEASYSRG